MSIGCWMQKRCHLSSKLDDAQAAPGVRQASLELNRESPALDGWHVVSRAPNVGVCCFLRPNLWLFLVSSVKGCDPITATWMPHVLSFHVEKGILLRISLARSVISSRAVWILDGYGSNHCLSPKSFMLSNMSLPNMAQSSGSRGPYNI